MTAIVALHEDGIERERQAWREKERLKGSWKLRCRYQKLFNTRKERGAEDAGIVLRGSVAISPAATDRRSNQGGTWGKLWVMKSDNRESCS
jgi:hypothetical protein